MENMGANECPMTFQLRWRLGRELITYSDLFIAGVILFNDHVNTTNNYKRGNMVKEKDIPWKTLKRENGKNKSIITYWWGPIHSYDKVKNTIWLF